MRLTNAPIKKILKVISLDDHNKNHQAKLTAFGILPGVRIELLQKKPVPVFQVGHSKFAIDKDLSDIVNVTDE